MPIYWFALLLSVLLSASANPSSNSVDRPMLLAWSCVFLWGLLAKTVAVVHARRVLLRRIELSAAIESLDAQMNGLRWVWLPVGAVAPIALGYGAMIRDSMVGLSYTATGVLLMLPSILAVASTWVAQHQFLDWANARSQESTLAMIARQFRLRASWILAPVLIVLGCIDLGNVILAPWGIQQDWFGGGIGLLVLPLVLPQMVQWIWSSVACQRNDDTAWLGDLVATAGYRGIPVRIWITGYQVSTAVIAGFIPGFRTLLLSDGLLSRLDRKCVVMVVMHELAHVARGHIVIRMMTLLPTWAVAGWLSFFVADTSASMMLSMGTGVVLTMLVMRFVSQATELDADRFAVTMVQRLHHRSIPSHLAPWIPQSRQEAAHCLAQALVTLCAGQPQSSRATWMHPSLSTRVTRLRQVAERADEGPSQSIAQVAELHSAINVD